MLLPQKPKGKVKHTLDGPDGHRPNRMIAALSSLLVALAFFVTGLWSGQAVFHFMALSTALIGIAETLRHQRVANAVMWVGRGGMLVTILYILIFLLPKT